MNKNLIIKNFLTSFHNVTKNFISQDENQCFIFCYHRITNSVPKPLAIERDIFRQQLDLFQKSGVILTPEKFFDCLKDKSKFPKTSFLLSFDDGYLSTVEFGAPILKEYNLRALSFIVTDFLGKENAYPIKQDHALSERVVTLEEVKQSSNEFLYQSHSHTHINCNSTDKNLVIEDLKKSQQWFEKNLGYRSQSLAYPFGLMPSWKNYERDLLDLGFNSSFITGSSSFKFLDQSTAYDIPRIGFLTDETIEHTQARLSGGLTVLKFLDMPFVRKLKNK